MVTFDTLIRERLVRDVPRQDIAGEIEHSIARRERLLKLTTKGRFSHEGRAGTINRLGARERRLISELDKLRSALLLTSSVADLPDNLTFVSDGREVMAIADDIGIGREVYDSFFVGVENGDYTEVWGMEGTIPHNDRAVYRVW